MSNLFPLSNRKFTLKFLGILKTLEVKLKIKIIKKILFQQGNQPLERSRINGSLIHNGNSLENLEQRWSLFRNRLMVPYEGHEVQKEKVICQKQTTIDANNIEEKHPDENISIVECSEDIVQTSSKHKLYFNPAYLEPELLMVIKFLGKNTFQKFPESLKLL